MLQPRLSIVIPVYNERKRLDSMFSELMEFQKKWEAWFEFVMVDDGSSDETRESILGHAAFRNWTQEGRAQLLQIPHKGKGGALQHGVSAAQGDFLLTLDADMAASPLELLRWLEIRGEFFSKEVLIGSRELPASKIKESFIRHWVGILFNFLIRLLTGLPYQDTQCGFKLYPQQVAKKVFADLHTQGWSHDVEILLRLNREGISIVEMPITWQAIPGSKISIWKDSFRMLHEVIRIRMLLGRVYKRIYR